MPATFRSIGITFQFLIIYENILEMKNSLRKKYLNFESFIFYHLKIKSYSRGFTKTKRRKSLIWTAWKQFYKTKIMATNYKDI